MMPFWPIVLAVFTSFVCSISAGFWVRDGVIASNHSDRAKCYGMALVNSLVAILVMILAGAMLITRTLY